MTCGDVLHVDAAGSQVRGNQDAIASLLKSGERRCALGLRPVAMNHGGGESFAIQIVGKFLVPRLVRENEAPAVSLASKLCSTACLRSPATSNAWTRTFSEGLSTDPNARRHRVFHVIAHEMDHRCFQRCGKTHRLALLR